MSSTDHKAPRYEVFSTPLYSKTTAAENLQAGKSAIFFMHVSSLLQFPLPERCSKNCIITLFLTFHIQTFERLFTRRPYRKPDKLIIHDRQQTLPKYDKIHVFGMYSNKRQLRPPVSLKHE